MLRDFKFLRRNSGKNPNFDEVENVPVNSRDSLGPLTGTEAPSRPPLNTIQEPHPTFKGGIDRELSFRGSKTDKTPTKPKATTTLPLRTPEKQGKSRYAWAQRVDSSSGSVESKDDGRVELVGDLIQSKIISNFNTPRSTRTDGRRANSSFSDCNSTQSTPNKSVTKPPNPGFRISSFAALSKGMPISCNSVTLVNSIEVPHFELKEDSSFWMEHNVQVLIRVRPLSNAEKSTHGYSRCLKQESAQCITWIGQPESRFTFDHVACETIDQETLFRMVGLPMVENCLSGYNSCMFAYGQTGSGKTHTMLGNVEEIENKPSPSRGMTPRIFEFLFTRIRDEEESRKDEKLRYHCKCSFLEIYNEQITDLLDPSSTNLLLREDVKKGVYVENLSEFEVHTVVDILKLLRQGASNRKVAATNMNRESSRSHSVFTCVIESSWEKDSTSNFRFARLNLVDLAGSERQKTSGAEGERLKEAANINKSLSTLGHVIMVLVDVANGRPKHIPYRDSRLTFLLQDSLGGNSKTMIIANVSPSMCCAAETLNTLKFAQRAKLIQNNAVVNEDSSGDVVALQNQIRLLKEELSLLKRQNVSRSLSFGPSMAMAAKQVGGDNSFSGQELETDQQGHLQEKEKGILRLSTKQLKSLETTLAGALRREQMAETSIKQLEAEIEQSNRLAHQREEDTRCSKMMLKFREDKIQRMESLISGLIPPDTYLLEENSALCDEIQILQAKLEKNPEVTRFALENIRLLEQLRRFQDFYEEGEREMLLAEVSGLRDQLSFYLDGNLKQFNHPKADTDHDAVNTFKENYSLRLELKRTVSELEECRSNLERSLECNAKLCREIEELRASLKDIKYAVPPHHETIPEVIEESISKAPSLGNQSIANEKKDLWHESSKKLTEEFVDLQLELDILKIILKEERSFSVEAEEKALSLCRDLELSEGKVLLITEQCQAIRKELEEAKSVIEALESQQILSFEEIEDLKHSNSKYEEVVLKQEQELSSLKDQMNHQEFRTISSLKHSKNKDCLLQEKMKKMHISFEKAKRLNERYQSDQALQSSNEEERDEVRRQVEAETAEVIVCLQEELTVLQQEVQSRNVKEGEMQERLTSSLAEMRILEEKLLSITQDNENLTKIIDSKEKVIERLTEEWELLTSEIVAVLLDGDESLKDVSNQLNTISSSLPQKKSLISSELERMRKHIFEKDLMIEELSRCLDDALGKRSDMESMLRSLKGAALVMTEVHQQECIEKDQEIAMLSSQLTAEASTILYLKDKIVLLENEIQKASKCATVAFLVVNRLSELNSKYLDRVMNMNVELVESIENIRNKDVIIGHQTLAIEEGEKQIQTLRKDLEIMKESCSDLRMKLSDEQKCSDGLRLGLEEFEQTNILKAEEKLAELKEGVSAVRSWMQDHTANSPENAPGFCMSNESEVQTGTKRGRDLNSYTDEDIRPKFQDSFCSIGAKDRRTLKDGKNRETTITLLKTEIENALEILKGVQAELAKLYKEKEKFLMSEKNYERSIEALVHQVLDLQGGMDSFEAEFQSKMDALNIKLEQFEEIVQYSCVSRFQEKELLTAELGEAKVAASQKATEASCILAKFEEAQDTMKEADIMINELLIANETLKLEAKEVKRKEFLLIAERDNLIKKTQSLQSINNLKDLQHEERENQLESDMMAIRSSMQELECIVSQVQQNSMEDFMSVASDCISMKCQLQNSIKLIKSCLEDIWSDIIVKDCAISVLHLCHIGVLLETVTGLNAENGLLYHGISGSDAVISLLREHNSQSKRELDRCRIVEGKLLADIKNSFDRMSKQEDETGLLSVKLTAFEQKILDLQHQEELMLQRSNYMGAELTELMKDLDLNNRNALESVLDQERLLMEKVEFLRTEEDKFILELSAKEFESLVLLSELKLASSIKADMEKEQIITSEIIATLKEHSVFYSIDAGISEALLLEKEIESSTLKDKCEKSDKQHQELLVELDKQNSAITQMNELNRVLLLDVQSQKEALALNDGLESSIAGLKKVNTDLSSQIEHLNSESQKFLEEKKMMEAALALSSSQSHALKQQNQMMQENISLLETASSQQQHDLEMKDRELGKLICLEKENKALLFDMGKKNSECSVLVQELEDKKDELESSLRYTNLLGTENQTLRDNIFSLENCISTLQVDLEAEKAALSEFQLNSCGKLNALEKENSSLRDEFTSFLNEKHEYLNTLSLNIVKFTDSVENMFQEMWIINESINNSFLEEFEHMEKLAKDLTCETVSLQTELRRKDDILSGLLFDMRLLQESASNRKDQKDEFECLSDSLETLEDELRIKSEDLNEAVLRSQKLEEELEEKISKISALESNVARGHEILKSLGTENLRLAASVKKATETKMSMEEELIERSKINEDLEKEVAQMGAALAEMNIAYQSLSSNLNDITHERDDLCETLAVVKKELEREKTISKENEALIAEAQEIAENSRLQVEDKEEEIKLLEQSIEDLECTVNVLENKVELLQGEAERQRLQREELESELHSIMQQMHNVKNCDADMKSTFDENVKKLQESLQRVYVLENEIAAKDAEISRCKSHICELNLHAEAQASEYKQKFKALEAMVEQLKQDAPAVHGTYLSANKLEKNNTKSRGSGSPFKCMGLGIVHQIKSEKEEEISAGRHRIEELEALAASRQKEIFLLNSRLAAAESMTHDVIRDLLGIKLDMNSCVSLLDNQQLQMLTQKAQLHNTEVQEKEREVVKLKQQLNEFIKERKGWLIEIERKQAEMVAAQVMVEKLRQKDQLLTAQNEMLKAENISHKERVMELESEVKKLSGQQNIQQRIHHHAKIKEENNLLRSQNDELIIKLRKMEALLNRVKEELAHYRAANGRSPCINFDEEQRLCNRLKETETERLQVAQDLVSLCTSILKAAGITKPTSEKISPAMAEEVLEQMKHRINTLERESQDIKLKNRMNNERIRLSELLPETSPLRSRGAEQISSHTQDRVVQTPFLSALDR